MGPYDFSEMYGLDWTLLVNDMRFLCTAFSPSIVLHPSLRSLVQFCSLVYSCSTSMPKINIFDHSTFPDLSILVEQDILFMVLSRFAPEWLLRSCRFTNRLHSNLDIEIPSKVIGTFSAGMKYIPPIAMKKSLVKESWSEFHDRALHSWDSAGSAVSRLELEKMKDTMDPFFLIQVPFVLKGQVKPYDGEPDKDVLSILQSGWDELKSLLALVPNLDRNSRSVDVESKDALEWCYANNVLIKPTDKNLGTALVSTVWYEEKVNAFIRNNKGYEIITEELAQTLVIRTVERVRDLCFNNSTTDAFVGNLSRFLGSRLPPVREVRDKATGYRTILPDDWSEIEVSLPIFNGLPKIHKSPGVEENGGGS